MYKNENLEKIHVIHRRLGEAKFRMAIQHLFDMGHQNFTEENVSESKEQIHRDTPENAIMTEKAKLERPSVMLPRTSRRSKMTTDHWTVAFTIVVDGIQVDFTELPEHKRIQILRSLFAGETQGNLYGEEHMQLEKSVS